MTNPTDPRIEAVARARFNHTRQKVMLERPGVSIVDFDELHEKDKEYWKEGVPEELKAADEAAWLPIESAPKLKDAYIDIWTNFYGGERYTDCSFRDGHWMIWIKDGFGDGEYERVPGTVTHWRPQPEGPKP